MTDRKKKITLWTAISFVIALVPVGGWLLPDPFDTQGGGDGGGRFDGQWRGTIARSSGDQWQVDITIDVARKTGSYDVSSPAMRCSGTLTVLGRSDRRLSVLEQLTRTGRGSCTRRAYITLSLAGTHVHVVWKDADSVHVTGEGDLSRG